MDTPLPCSLDDIIRTLGHPGDHQLSCLIVWHTFPHARELLELIARHYDFSNLGSKSARIYKTVIDEYLKTLDDVAEDELAEAVNVCINCKHVKQGCLNWQLILSAVNMVLSYHIMCLSRLNADRKTFKP